MPETKDKSANQSSSALGGEQGAAWIDYIHGLQDSICAALEKADGKAKFFEDVWERPEGGGGKTRVIANGNVFEKGGVNTSVVFGEVTDVMKRGLEISGDTWFACGLSLVLHPSNPFVPTVHCNYRMFELYNKEGGLIDRWFGGGTDLTPYYLIEEDAKHFHQTYKNVCDSFDPSFYEEFKKICDDYFVNTHRGNERRGIGGIFYDHKRELPSFAKQERHPQQYFHQQPDNIVNSLQKPEANGVLTTPMEEPFWMLFGKACGNAFIEAYVPIVEKRKNTPFTAENKYWQEIRRGRYVEFNLVHDRGTLFGLKTNGRTESILMSLPPTVRFEYNYITKAGSEEEKLTEVCLHPRNWV